jgi:hypothetical protein
LLVLADVAGRGSPRTGAAASNRRRSAVLRTVDRALLPHVQARPCRPTIYHQKRESIEAHLSIVFAAAVVSKPIEARTGWSIRNFVRTARIRAGRQILTAEDPHPGRPARVARDHRGRPGSALI